MFINQGFDFGSYLTYSLDMGRNALIVLVVILVILLLGVGYLIFRNQQITPQFGKYPSPSPTSTTTTPFSPSDQLVPMTPSQTPILTLSLTQNAIKTNINAKNYQGLVPYMTNQVSRILQATECCGPEPREATVSQMSYIEEGIPFNFDQEQELVKNLKSKNPELTNQFIGVSINKEHLVAFTINRENKISEVRMSVSWKLFNY